MDKVFSMVWWILRDKVGLGKFEDFFCKSSIIIKKMSKIYIYIQSIYNSSKDNLIFSQIWGLLGQKM